LNRISVVNFSEFILIFLQKASSRVKKNLQRVHSSDHEDVFFLPAKTYATIVTADTRTNFIISMNTSKMTPGNSMGRASHTIRAEQIRATIRIMTWSRFIRHLHVDMIER